MSTLHGSVITQSVARILRGRMAELQRTQIEAARAVGVSQGQMSKLLRGEREFDLALLFEMCTYLRIPITEVVDRAFREAADALREVREGFSEQSRIEGEADWIAKPRPSGGATAEGEER